MHWGPAPVCAVEAVAPSAHGSGSQAPVAPVGPLGPPDVTTYGPGQPIGPQVIVVPVGLGPPAEEATQGTGDGHVAVAPLGKPVPLSTTAHDIGVHAPVAGPGQGDVQSVVSRSCAAFP
jgi:hypothetical protein